MHISTLLSFFYLCLIKTINHTRPLFIYFVYKCFFFLYFFFICYYLIISLLISSLLHLSYSQVMSKQKILAVVDLVFTSNSKKCYYILCNTIKIEIKLIILAENRKTYLIVLNCIGFNKLILSYGYNV